jgi:DNA-binding transcriptional MerR regulator
MDQVARELVFKAQCENVIALVKAKKQISRAINEALRQNNDVAATILAKSLALVFCAWVEASFSKLIHTPHGFTLDEIKEIKQKVSRESVVAGWERCIEIAMTDHDAARSSFDEQDRKKLEDCVDLLIKEPSEIRNKIAHGQWIKALNSKHTSINAVATSRLSDLSSVKIDTWFICQEKLIEVVEHLIHSPNKAFIHTYRQRIDELENLYSNRQSWTDMGKKAILASKKATRPQRQNGDVT